MKRLLLILLCLPFIGFGQGWEHTYGGTTDDFGHYVQQTIDGGYIITGYTESLVNGDRNILLMKIDGNGVEQWTENLGGTSSDYGGRYVQQTTDGGYIITGAFGDGDGFLIKTDGNGIEQWIKTLESKGKEVQQTTDGGYIVVTGAALVKIDGNGQEQWNQAVGGLDDLWAGSVQQTNDGGYIMTGHGAEDLGLSGSGPRYVILIKTDGSGIVQWSKTYGGIYDDEGHSVQQTTDGGYIITGYIEFNGTPFRSVYLIKTDGSGNEEWSKTFGGTDFSFSHSVQQTTDGGYIIGGNVFTSSFDIYLIKTDGNGIEQWTKTLGGTAAEQTRSAQQTTDGGYIITGYTESFGNGNKDVYLIKTDGNGNATSTFNIPINPNRKLQKTVDILGKETKPQTNTPLIEIYDDGTVEKRIVIE